MGIESHQRSETPQTEGSFSCFSLTPINLNPTLIKQANTQKKAPPIESAFV